MFAGQTEAAELWGMGSIRKPMMTTLVRTTETNRSPDRTPPSTLWLMAPVLLAAFTAPWSLIKPFGPFAVADLMLVLAIIATVPVIIVKRLPFSIPMWFLIPGIVIPICVLARLIDPPPYFWRVLRLQVQQYHPESFLKALIWLAALYIVPTAIIASAMIERRVVDWIMGAYVLGVVVSSVVALTDLFRLTSIAAHLNYNGLGLDIVYDWGGRRFPGLSDHPNTLGLTILISIPMVVYFMGQLDRKYQWAMGVALILLAGGLLASGSRAAQALAFPCLLVAVVIQTRKKKKETAKALSVTLLVGIATGVGLLLTVLRSDIANILRFTGEGAVGAEASNRDRLTIIQQSWNDWQTYPVFGAGIRHIVEAHSLPVQLLAAGGVVLAGGMVAYFVCILRDAWLLVKSGVPIARFLMVSIGIWLTYGMINNQLTDRELYFTVGCVAALVVLQRTSPEPPTTEPEDAESPVPAKV
jgi:hypothetical protein